MAGKLDGAIRGVLLSYARIKELDQQENDVHEVEGFPPSEDTSNSEAGSDQATEKKAKMLRVARMLVDSNPRIRNKGSLAMHLRLSTSRGTAKWLACNRVPS